jgi:hypothetical protein
MYLTQVLDWLNGQGWYDNVQHRLNPPEGVPIHFSRFAMAPMAVLTLLFQVIGFGPRGAATLMALFYPLILLGGLMLAVRWLAECFVPKEWAGVTAYVTLFATGMMFMFMPGHVDHHGLIVLLVALTLGFVARMIRTPEEPLWGLSAGLVLAFGLTIALEILPFLLLISAFMGLWAIVKGRGAARNTFAFGLALHLGSIVFLLLTRPPAQFFTPDVLTYSFVYVLLTGGIAVSFAGIAALANAPTTLRWMIGAGLGALTGFLFLHRFPELVTGPYGGMDPQLAELMLDEIDEAKPLIHIQKGFFNLATHIGAVTLALVTTFYFVKNPKNDERWRWGLVLTLLAASFALTLFYQYRFMSVMGLMTIIPLTALLQRGWLWIGDHYTGRKKVFAEIGLLLLVGPLPSVLLPALVDGRSFNVGILLFPVDSSTARTPCDTFALEQILKDPRLYGDHPRLIVSAMGDGPELLFRTDHQVLSAPFHMDVTGNLDAIRFFSTPYASEAEAIVRRRHIDLVVACRYVPAMYTRSLFNKDGTKNDEGAGDSIPHFIELLMQNKQPDWLKAPKIREPINYTIFEVQPLKSSPAVEKKSQRSK